MASILRKKFPVIFTGIYLIAACLIVGISIFPLLNLEASITTDFTFTGGGTRTVGPGAWDELIFKVSLPINTITDTLIAGTGTDTAVGTATFPAGWSFYGYDAVGGGLYNDSADWIGTDDDGDGVYTSAADILADADGSLTTTWGGGTAFSTTAGDTLTAFDAGDNFCWYDTDSSSTVNSGDVLWVDDLVGGACAADNDGGEVVVVGTAGGNAGTQITGTTQGLAYNDSDTDGTTGDGIYDPGQDIYVENVAGELTLSTGADTLVAGVVQTPGVTLVNMNSAKPVGWTDLLISDNGTPGTWESGLDFIFTDDDTSTYYNADKLISIQLGNIGTCTDSDIDAIWVYEDDGDTIFNPATDNFIGGLVTPSAMIGQTITVDGTLLSSNDSAIWRSSDGERLIFITVDSAAASNGNVCTFIGRVPQNSVVLASDNDGPTDGPGTTADVLTLDLQQPTVFTVTTDDSDGNGMIDTINISTTENLNDNFGDITATVAGYTVSSIDTGATGNDTDFVINLTETGTCDYTDLSGCDTGATPTVSIVANTLLTDSAGNSVPTGALGNAVDAASPIVVARATLDFTKNGQIDGFYFIASEALDMATPATSFGTISATVTGYVVNTGASGTTNGWVAGFNPNDFAVILDESGFSDTDATPTSQITNTSLEDLNGNALVSDTGLVSSLDGAEPIILSATYQDANADGIVDQFTLTFSETIDASASVFAHENLVLTSGWFYDDGASFGTDTTDLLTLDTSSLVVTLSSLPSSINTNDGSGTIAINLNDNTSGTATQDFALVDLAGLISAYGSVGNGAGYTWTQSSIDSILDGAMPILTSFTSTTGDGTYGPTDTINITANYSENIAGGTVIVSLNNGVTGLTLSSISGNQISGTYTVGALGSLEDVTGLDVSAITAHSATDGLNANSSLTMPSVNITTSSSIGIDTVAPYLVGINLTEPNGDWLINEADADSINTATVTLIFSEPMDTLTLPIGSTTPGDINASSGFTWDWIPVWSSGNTQLDLSWILSDGNEEFTASAVQVSVMYDVAGNLLVPYDGIWPLPGPGQTLTVDTIAPTGTVLVDTDPITLTDNTQTVTVTYDEAMDPGSTPTITFTGSVNFSTNSDGAWSTVTFANDTWTESFDHDGTPEEVAGVSVDSADATDVAGNTEGASTADTFDIDTIAPSVNSITVAAGSGAFGAIKIGDTSTVTIVMSEPVAGFTNADVTTPNGTLGALSTGDNVTFTGTFTPNVIEDATNTASVATTFTDTAGNNASAGATSGNYIIDTIAPTGTVTVVTDPLYEGDLIQEVTVTYDENMDPASTPTITFVGNTGALTSNADGSWTAANVWYETFTLTDADEETVGVTVDSLGATDVAGNTEGASVPDTFDVDTSTPTLAEVTPVTTPTTDTTPDYTFSSDEAGTITLGGGCDSVTTAASVGSNTITLDADGVGGALSDAVYNCTVVVTDTAGNASTTLNMTAFRVDTAPPTVFTYSPTDNATGVSISADLVLTFNENVQVGTGNVVIKKASDNSTVETINITDGGKVTFNGTTGVTINPAATLLNNTGYYVQIDAGAIEDVLAQPYAGIADTTTWNFTTVAVVLGGGGGGGYVPPATTYSIVIANGAAETTTQTVSLTLSGTNATSMMIANTADFAGVDWETYATSKTWSLTDNYGSKIVYVKFRDASNNVSNVISDTISYVETIIVPINEGDLILNDPVPAAELPVGVTIGTLVKRADMSSVYFIDQDNRRHAFPNEAVYMSYYSDFSGVQTISSETMAAIPLGSNVTMRPGTYLVKIQSDPKVYAVSPYSVLKWVSTEAIAVSLYGSNWGQRIVDVDPTFFINYQIGSAITSAIHPTGSAFSYAGDTKVYYVDQGVKRYVSTEAFINNKLQNKFIIRNVSTAITYNSGTDWPVMSMDQIVTLR